MSELTKCLDTKAETQKRHAIFRCGINIARELFLQMSKQRISIGALACDALVDVAGTSGHSELAGTFALC